MKLLTAAITAFLLSLGTSYAQGIQTAGIDHVGMNVPDLKNAEAFFSSTFGCVPVTQIGPFPLSSSRSTDGKNLVPPRADSVTISMLRCGSGSNVELFEYKNSTGSSVFPNPEDIGSSHIAFYTDDVKAGVAYLKDQGITIIGEPITMTGGDTAGETWVHFLSPWGSVMELVGSPNGKGYEKTAKVKLWSAKNPAN